MERRASCSVTASMIVSCLSLLYLTTSTFCLHNSDVWLGQMDHRLPKSSNRIETFVFPTKKIFNVREVGGSRREESLNPLYFKFRNKVTGEFATDRSLRIQPYPHRYGFQGKDTKQKLIMNRFAPRSSITSSELLWIRSASSLSK